MIPSSAAHAIDMHGGKTKLLRESLELNASSTPYRADQADSRMAGRDLG